MESVAAYLAELKTLSEHCSFGDSLDDMLRDRIVCGIQDQRAQRRLLAEPDLTLKRVFEVAQAIESADTQVKNSYTLSRQKCTPSYHSSDRSERRSRRALPSMIVHRHRLFATRRSLIHCVPLRLHSDRRSGSHYFTERTERVG